MFDGRYDPAFHQAFVVAETAPADLALPGWLAAVLLSALLGGLAMIALITL
ncbi:MAG: hypothetical protein RIT14_786 [Pseudomonadota bacterium]|jgi:hypothetical protein